MAEAGAAAAIRPGASRAGRSPSHNPWLIAATVTISSAMELLDRSVVNVAIPRISGSMSATYEETTWILTAYLISTAIIVPASGWLALRIGRKRYYMGSVAAFIASSLLCGIAMNLRFLVGFRVLQGAAGGGLGPSEQAILADTFPISQTALAFAVYGIAIVLAPTLGPTLGGYLTVHFGWRAIFFINIPVGLIALYLTNRMVEDPPYIKAARAKKRPIDYTGLALLVLGLGSLQFILDRGQRLAWFESTLVVALTLVAGIAIITLLIWEWFQHSPIINLRLFKHRNFAIAFIMMGILAAVLYGTLLMVPEFLQLMLNFNAEQAGAVLWPTVFAILPLLLIVGLLLSIVDARVLIFAGFLATAFATFHISHSLSLSISSIDMTRLIVYQAVGLTLLFVPITTISYADVPRERNNALSSLLNFARSVGGSCGISLVTTLLARRAKFHASILASSVTPYNPLLHSSASSYFEALRGAGAGSADAMKLASKGLFHTLASQAGVLSYIDVFWMLAMITLFTTPLVFLMKRETRSGPPQF